MGKTACECRPLAAGGDVEVEADAERSDETRERAPEERASRWARAAPPVNRVERRICASKGRMGTSYKWRAGQVASFNPYNAGCVQRCLALQSYSFEACLGQMRRRV